jgi:hypothetical protein
LKPWRTKSLHARSGSSWPGVGYTQDKVIACHQGTNNLEDPVFFFLLII